jgi:hypothetical protein
LLLLNRRQMGFCHERPGHQNAESRLVVDWIAAAGHILNCGIGLYFLADIFGGAAISEIAPHQHSETVLYQGTTLRSPSSDGYADRFPLPRYLICERIGYFGSERESDTLALNRMGFKKK